MCTRWKYIAIYSFIFDVYAWLETFENLVKCSAIFTHAHVDESWQRQQQQQQ